MMELTNSEPCYSHWRRVRRRRTHNKEDVVLFLAVIQSLSCSAIILVLVPSMEHVQGFYSCSGDSWRFRGSFGNRGRF